MRAPEGAGVGAVVFVESMELGQEKSAEKEAYRVGLPYPKVELRLGCVMSNIRVVEFPSGLVWLVMRMLPYLLAVLKKYDSGHELTIVPLVEFLIGHFETSIVLGTPDAVQVWLQGQPTTASFK